MYNYLLFCYNTYYPGGGMSDCVLKFNNIYHLKKYLSINDKLLYLEATKDLFMNDYVEIYDIVNDCKYEYKINRDISHEENATLFLNYCKEEIGIEFI